MNATVTRGTRKVSTHLFNVYNATEESDCCLSREFNICPYVEFFLFHEFLLLCFEYLCGAISSKIGKIRETGVIPDEREFL
jgi:hypothetical protein